MLNPLLPSNELAGADFVRSFGLARRVVTLPDLPEGLPEPYDDRAGAGTQRKLLLWQ